LKPLALFDDAAKWELKADQIAAGYDSIFVSVIPRASNMPVLATQQTTDSSIHSKQVGSSMQQTISQMSREKEDTTHLEITSG
jgi:hypothetical protein